MSNKILLVDDDPTSLKITAGILDQRGYKTRAIDHAGNIEHAVASFAPHCIIMDLLMPGVDGSEGVRRLQKVEALKDIPVIFLTAVNMHDDESGTDFDVAVGALTYRTLIKPVDGEVLVKEIEALTGNKGA